MRGFMPNNLADRKEHCEKFGIKIVGQVQFLSQMYGQSITDMETEYISDTFKNYL